MTSRSEQIKRLKQKVGEFADRVHALILEHPTFGYRRIWAMLCFRQGMPVNLKTVDRLFKLKVWSVHQRVKTARPRAAANAGPWM
jgi:L-rhamnose isomerase